MDLTLQIVLLFIGVGGALVSALSAPKRHKWRVPSMIGFGLLGALGLVLLVLTYVHAPEPSAVDNSVTSNNRSGGQTARTIINQNTPPPAYAGKLEAEILLSGKDKTLSRTLEVGDSGTLITMVGPQGTPIFKLFERYDLLIESISDELKVSTRVADKYGHLVAELIRNEWKVAPPPKTWDRNYNKNALEVKDETGNIVLQVVALPDRIRLQGEWWVDPLCGRRSPSKLHTQQARDWHITNPEPHR
jgi:hypothetical protein